MWREQSDIFENRKQKKKTEIVMILNEKFENVTNCTEIYHLHLE